MGKIGAQELIIILIIVLVIFGPSRLPELGKALGQTISQFKNNAREREEKNKEELNKKDTEEDIK